MYGSVQSFVLAHNLQPTPTPNTDFTHLVGYIVKRDCVRPDRLPSGDEVEVGPSQGGPRFGVAVVACGTVAAWVDDVEVSAVLFQTQVDVPVKGEGETEALDLDCRGRQSR